MSQSALFPSPENAARVLPAPQPETLAACAASLQARWGGRLFLGTSSWYFPGWADWVWARAYPQALLAREGLAVYAQHRLLRTVSLDRAFYRPLEAGVYARLAAQTGPEFRFVVKAAALVADATQRKTGSGAPVQANPKFLDPTAAVDLCVRPALAGLGDKFGALVFQLSPLPRRWLEDEAGFLARLSDVLAAVRSALPSAVRVAVEVRDASLVTPALAAVLSAHGAHYALGLHDRMPTVREQLPMLRALWPGDLVCRWNLQRGLRYAEAREGWAPFDRMQAPDEATRQTLARVARATLDAGHSAFITINNKAEGCAPASVLALAQALLDGD